MSDFLPGRSYLVVGQLDEGSLSGILPIDRVEIESDDLPIKDLRSALSRAQGRPFGLQRLLVIRQAEQLSEACQNTLLKVLEEPPVTLTVILEVRSPEGLLSTVQSRLERRSGTAQEKEKLPLLPSQEAAALQTLQGFNDRRTLTALLKQELRFQLQNLKSLTRPDRLGFLEQAITSLEHNCNQKLVIDRFLLRWFSETGNG